MKHYIVEFYSNTIGPTVVKIETDKAMSTKSIRVKLAQLGFKDVSLAWVSGLK